MLTQIQIPEPQAALLAACPRPRAVAPSALMPLMPSSSPAWVGVVRLGAVAEERRRGFAAAASGTRGFGYAAAARVVAAGTVGNGNGNGTASKQQDKQHLTTRREPVTWRPPH